MTVLLLWLALAGAPRVDDTPTFDFRADAEFRDPRPALQMWLAHRPRVPTGEQHFCVVGYRSDHSRWAWVHWKEGRMLLLWDGGTEPDTLVMSRRQLSLKTDVVPTQDDLHGSTYLVSKPWVDERLDDCAKHGFRYAVRAGKRTKRGRSAHSAPRPHFNSPP